MAKRFHPEHESANGILVGDMVQCKTYDWDYGRVLEIRSGYTNGSGIRAKVRRESPPHYENAAKIVLWDVLSLTVLEAAPGARIDGRPDGADDPPVVVDDPMDRLNERIKRLEKRIRFLENAERARRTQMKTVQRTLRVAVNAIDQSNRYIEDMHID
jgi:hypothetical protein